MAFKMKGHELPGPMQRKKIKYDEDKDMEYVKHRGKKVYGSWNEFEPNKKNKVRTKGLKNHLIEKDGDLHVDEATWDSTLSHNENTRKTEDTKGQQRRRKRRKDRELRRKKREIRREKDD